MRRLLIVLSAVAFASTLAAGCGSVEAKCENGTCHLVVRGDDSFTIGGQTVRIGHVSDHSVTISSTGAEFLLTEGESITIGGKTLKLSRIEGGSVSLDVDPNG
ncbi:hypothetical protein [Kutzneria sp. NPDC052558]|uniref:hypothetical protein n=1 Tax=Kutzneria sp. NPDC052558 TaxID=3364121 RepID=UPI0037CB88A4